MFIALYIGGAPARAQSFVSFYVSSPGTNEVRRYNGGNGSFIEVFVTAGSGGLNGPRGISFGGDGNFYVSSFNTDEVFRYDGATGGFLDTVVTAGSGGLTNPTGLMFGPDRRLYVSSSGSNQVIRYDRTTGQFLGVFVQSGGFGPSDPSYILFNPRTQGGGLGSSNCSLAGPGARSGLPWLLLTPLAFVIFIRLLRAHD